MRVTIAYGDEGTVLDGRDIHQNPVYVTYIPEVIGSGTSIYQVGLIACSGVCLVSPVSVDYGHPFPVLTDWVNEMFPGVPSICRRCADVTEFAQPVCEKCYYGADVLSLPDGLYEALPIRIIADEALAVGCYE